MTPPEAALDPSVCYRHPDRASWTLCQRCGRTICPECQILTPSGVRCPDCVRETGGSVQWTSTNPAPAKKKKVRARRPSAERDYSDRPRWQQTLLEMLRPRGASGVAVSWVVIGLAVVVWIIGLLTANLPASLLAADPTVSWQVWRYATGAIAYPSSAFLALLLNSVFFALIGPSFEAQVGKPRFLVLFFASTIVGAAVTVLAGGLAFGLTGALFGVFGAYLVMVWSVPQARTQLLIVIGINVLLGLVFGGNLPALVGGLLAGAGSMYVLRRYEDAPTSRTPRLIIGGGVAAFVVLAVIRGLAAA